MRSPDRGSTKRPAVLHGRRPPEGRAQRVNPPLTATSKKSLTFFFYIFSAEGDEKPRPGFDKTARRFAWPQATRRASAASESPSHRHIQRRARLTSGLFFCIFCAEGDEKPRPGFDKTARRFAWPQATRRASAASESPSHRHLQRRA